MKLAEISRLNLSKSIFSKNPSQVLPYHCIVNILSFSIVSVKEQGWDQILTLSALYVVCVTFFIAYYCLIQWPVSSLKR